MKKTFILASLLLCVLASATAQTTLTTAKHIRALQKLTLDSVSITKIVNLINYSNTHTQLPTAKAVYDAFMSTDTDPADDITDQTNLGGDLLGQLFPNPLVTGIQGFPIAATAPTSGQVLTWNGATWAAAAAGSINAYAVTVTGGNVGATLRVVASGTGVTAAYSGGEITVTVPTGVTLLSASYRGAFGDIQGGADTGGATNWVRLKFSGLTGNTSTSDMRVPVVQKLIFASGNPSLTAPYTISQGNNPAQAVVGVGSGTITIRFAGMGGATNGYQITCTGF